jgi:hypothetical protein
VHFDIGINDMDVVNMTIASLFFLLLIVENCIAFRQYVKGAFSNFEAK